MQKKSETFPEYMLLRGDPKYFIGNLVSCALVRFLRAHFLGGLPHFLPSEGNSVFPPICSCITLFLNLTACFCQLPEMLTWKKLYYSKVFLAAFSRIQWE